jgi:lysophospholipase L1-like esterase
VSEESLLPRWHTTPVHERRLACIGDSITDDREMKLVRVESNWVSQVRTALGDAAATAVNDGFCGLWHEEWTRTGAWSRATRADAFDVAPFGHEWYSSGESIDELTWTRPQGPDVASFELLWCDAPGSGAWQYRVDGDDWQSISLPPGPPDGRIHRLVVDQRVHSHVQVRGYDGAAPCIAHMVGIVVASTPRPDAGPVLHNLGQAGQLLAEFCRPSAGDPLALLDELRPHLATIMFTNDVRVGAVDVFAARLRQVIERLRPYADVLVMTPFEQRGARRVDDAVTVAGSTRVTSASARFLRSDLRVDVQGTTIASGSHIVGLPAPDVVTLNKAATGSSDATDLEIVVRRSPELQAAYRAAASAVAKELGCPVVDLHAAWRAEVGAGWDAAYAAGLMHDGLHPSQRGHDDIARRVTAILGLDPN